MNRINKKVIIVINTKVSKTFFLNQFKILKSRLNNQRVKSLFQYK